MLEKPDIHDEKIIACLQTEYGLPITRVDFLPLGGDLCSAVYRARAGDGTAYFCKLRCGDFEEISVDLPRFLSEQGIAQIIPILLTTTGRPWVEIEPFRIILYPFIEGSSGFEMELQEQHWAEFGSALKQIHSTILPHTLAQKIEKERYSPEWRESCREIIHRLDRETFEDPITAGLAAFLNPKRAVILELIAHAERLSHMLASHDLDFVLCHSDIHPGNLFLDTKGALHIVDWDRPILAPKELDLMFIGGGQGYLNCSAQEEETRFYRSYGPSPVNFAALAYYRCERNLVDLTVECTRIFSSTLGDLDRAQSLEIITWLWLPEGSINMAYKALRNLDDAQEE